MITQGEVTDGHREVVYCQAKGNTRLPCLLQVLLTLYANIVERWPATDADSEEPASDGGAAAAAGPALELDAAFCSTLATLQDQGLAGDDDALAQILALAAQQAAVCAQLQQTLAAADGIRLSAEFQQRLADFDALAGQGGRGCMGYPDTVSNTVSNG